MARRQIRTLTPTELARVQQGALVRIVDDDDSLRDALRFVLETEGWRVADYRSANDFFRGDAPSVPGCVVMDVRMPGLTGIEAQAVMNERGAIIILGIFGNTGWELFQNFFDRLYRLSPFLNV